MKPECTISNALQVQARIHSIGPYEAPYPIPIMWMLSGVKHLEYLLNKKVIIISGWIIAYIYSSFQSYESNVHITTEKTVPVRIEQKHWDTSHIKAHKCHHNLGQDSRNEDHIRVSPTA